MLLKRLGRTINELRDQLDVAQEKLAGAADISTRALSRLESGAAKDVKLSTLEAIAAALGVTVVDLLAGPGESAARLAQRPRQRPGSPLRLVQASDPSASDDRSERKAALQARADRLIADHPSWARFRVPAIAMALDAAYDRGTLPDAGGELESAFRQLAGDHARPDEAAEAAKMAGVERPGPERGEPR